MKKPDATELLTECQRKLIDAGAEIRTFSPLDGNDTSYLARQLVQVTLPHRSPGDVPVWQRVNGNLTLTIRPGWNSRRNEPFGYPYGTIPRLLLFWINTEAVRTHSRLLNLGDSLAGFMRQRGLDPARGGKRSDARRLRDQMQRLFRATISFEQAYEAGAHQGDRWLDMQVAPEGELWWDPENGKQSSQFPNWIELSEKFYESITSAPVPVDVRALRALKRSPLALDLYAWTTYRTYRVTQAGQEAFIPWRALSHQLGTNYRDIKDFKRKARRALRMVQTVYPGLNLKFVDGGVLLLPGVPAVLPATR